MIAVLGRFDAKSHLKTKLTYNALIKNTGRFVFLGYLMVGFDGIMAGFATCFIYY